MTRSACACQGQTFWTQISWN